MLTDLLLVGIFVALCLVVLGLNRIVRSTGPLAHRADLAIAVLEQLRQLEADEAHQRTARIQQLLTVRGSGREQLRERLARRLAEREAK